MNKNLQKLIRYLFKKYQLYNNLSLFSDRHISVPKSFQRNYIFVLLGIFLCCFPKHNYAQVDILKHPADSAICSSADAAFLVVASNASHYHWQENDGVSWTDLEESVTYVSGVFSPTLEILDANTGLDGYKYRCKVKDDSGNIVVSNEAKLNVNDPPVIVEFPKNQRECRNSWVSFNVGASNSTAYKWQENSGIGWVDLEDNAFCSGVETKEISMYVTTGMNSYKYRCLVYQGGCALPSSSGLLMVDPIPISYEIMGGGTICENSEGLNIGLSNSEKGVKYELFVDEEASGIVLEGNDIPLDFGKFANAGTYTIKATNSSTGCQSKMNGEAVIDVESLPTKYKITGGGNMCENSDGLNILLEDSDIGVKYTLFLDDQPTDVEMEGTGEELNFGLFIKSGIYTVIGEKLTTSCFSTMEGNVEIIVHQPPIAKAGEDQTIEEGTSCQLSATAEGGSGNYKFSWIPGNLLQKDSDPQYPVTENLYNTTLFFLTVKDLDTECVSKNDTTIIYVTDTELSVHINASPSTICNGGTSTLIGLGSGGNGNYTYSWSSTPSGFSSTSSTIHVSPQKTTVYTLTVSDGANVVEKSVQIEVVELPEIFTVKGGGGYCKSEKGVEISLSGSQKGVVYDLVDEKLNVIRSIAGTGEVLSFGKVLDEGKFHVTARVKGLDCAEDMNEIVEIKAYDNPIVKAGEDLTISFKQKATLTSEVKNGSGEYTYNWKPESKLKTVDIPNPETIELEETVVFDIQVTDNKTSCKSNTDNLVVYVTDGPLSLNVVAETESVCPKQKFEIYALPSGGSGNYSCLWSSRPKGFVSGKLTTTTEIVEDTWFIASVTDGNATLKDSVLVRLGELPVQYNITGGGKYCPIDEGVAVGLSGSSEDVDYSLMLNDKVVNESVAGSGSAISFGKQSIEGNYKVLAVQKEGCSINMSGSTQISKAKEPKKFNLLGGGTWCQGDLSAGVLLNESEEGIFYQLVHEDELTDKILEGSGLPLHFSGVDKSGNYSVIAKNGDKGCEALMNNTVKVELLPLPKLSVLDNVDICEGENAELTVSGAKSYVWEIQPPTDKTKIIVNPKESTTYLVTGKDENGCKSTASVTVNVNSLPDFDYFLDKNQKKIIISPSSYDEYLIMYGDNILYQGENAEFYLGELCGKVDSIRVITTNQFNCKQEKKVPIEQIKDINAFSPNGDGINDVFMRGAQITVIDKWGLKVFQGNQGWDGTHGSLDAAPGTYYFVEKIFDQNNNLVKIRKGSVTLVRN
ncbi:MAG: gliding motility-associated C-terminal domain-containing protein [Bacteroidales bacterium]